jgi:hypothetical protein
VSQHLPFIHRPDDESRHTIPAEVCDTCSDFAMGRLVAVAFCSTAKVRSDEMYEYLEGGPRPAWMGPSVFEEE